MNKVLPTIQEIQKEINALSEAKTLAQAQRVILSVIRLLDSSVSLDDSKQFQLFNVDNQKISANAQWFYEDNVVVDRRAIYKIHSDNSLNIDFKLYGITKPSKRTISWIQALTPNFEDEPFNSKFNIGIDFVVPKSVDKVIIVLSNNYVVRTLELKGTLTATFQEILAKWASISDFSNKKEVHSILWESFDLQPLNKKFYAGISERFITLRQHLTKEKILDDKHASLFANRLLGRVIFCWFLDKKGVINPERKYFDSHSFTDDSEYYRKNLENLFFGVLNTPIADREYKDDVTPFLNGGLFEARDTDLYKNSKLSFPKNYFDDLFDFLSGYNFTTDESTSQFQQVAIDPEMLGRIFENLLAEMTEETGEQARKAKGAFYTPREIVDYMCRESLREYLKTKIPEDQFRDQRFVQLIDAPDKDFQDQDHNWRRDWKPYKDAIIKALDELKVLDPACGSGAFPIGMLQLLVRVYERLEPRFDTYKAKLQIVEKNIYGVDIDPMAIEISRLRAWLSIIVDEEADSKKIKPLPNLEFKFICANSIIDLDQSGQVTFWDDPRLEKDLQEIRDAYFNTENINKKKKLRADYEKAVTRGGGLFGESLRTQQLKTYRPFDNEWSTSFFNPVFMFGVSDFNIVIGNPPYVSYGLRGVGKTTSFESEYFKKHYQNSAEYKISLYAIFIERALQLCSDQGIQSFIVPDSFLLGKYFSKIRRHILDKTQIEKILLLSQSVFGAVVGYSVVYLFRKTNSERGQIKAMRVLDSELKTIESYSYPQSTFGENNLNRFRLFFSKEDMKFVESVERFDLKIKDIIEFKSGLISKSGQKNIISDQQGNDEWKKGVISGSEIKGYSVHWAGNYIHYKKELIKSGYGNVEYFNPKVFVRQTGDKITCAYDKSGYLCLNNVHVGNIISDKIPVEVVVAILNSGLINKYYQIISLEKGRVMAQIDIDVLESIPVPSSIDKKIQTEIIKIVENLSGGESSESSVARLNQLVEAIYEDK